MTNNNNCWTDTTIMQQYPNNHHLNGNQLATSLPKSIQKRALHFGVTTQDILNIYYHTIQAIPHIIQNPTTDQYQSILSPTQTYLKKKDLIPSDVSLQT